VVKMKNRVLTNGFRNIRRSIPRFLSLFIMSLLGVFVFVGLKSTAPDMLKTLDRYLDRADGYDLKIVSGQGLTSDDVSALKDVAGIEEAEGVRTCDLLFSIGEDQYVLRVSSMPEKINRLNLIEGAFPEKSNEIVVEENLLSKNGLHLNDRIALHADDLKESEFIIVGTVDSSLYFNNTGTGQNRGSTSIGSGTVHYYAYVPEETYQTDYYSAVYLTVKGAKEETTSSKAYLEKIDSATAAVGGIQAEREEIRYRELYSALEKSIDEEEGNGLLRLAEYRSEIDRSKAAYLQAETQWKSVLTAASLSEETLDSSVDQLEKQIADSLRESESLDPESEEYASLMLQIETAETRLAGMRSLQSTREELKIQAEQIRIGENEYAESARVFNEEIESARKELSQLKKGTWYIQDRSDDSTYSDYIDDTLSIDNLAGIFPLIFYAVAVLVSLISMNRMVEDDRLEIGTLKSLGFSNAQISIKYLLFAFLATLIGGIVGCALGSVIIPSLIFNIYRILFDVPDFSMAIHAVPSLLGILISFVCVVGTTLFTVSAVLREKPSELMRQKAPKGGKRVVLERVDFIWKRLSFSNKVTVRNLFRYKKRVAVTIFGIAGCTALMLCGFGLKDSISNIPEKQYGEVFTFDGMAYLNSAEGSDIGGLFSDPAIESVTEVESLNATLSSRELTLFVSDGDKVGDIVCFRDRNGNALSLESGKVIISEKLADLEKLKAGDTISFVDIHNVAYTYEISGICKNYINHYVFVDSMTFEESGQHFLPNVVFFSTSDLDENQRDLLSASLLSNDEIISVSFVDVLIEQVDNMLRSLNKVVIILIVLAALLSFVVLYNLSNINIHERKREIATLKVLGFYDKEVDQYITKENILLTCIGIAIGLLAGYFVTHLVIATVEIERARFIRQIFFTSYLFSAMIAFLFTFIVNFVTHFSLKRIDMIESLKSVE